MADWPHPRMAQPTPLISSRYPYLPIEFTVQGARREVEALIDTGFDGGVVLSLGTPGFSPPPGGEWSPWQLADGSVIWAPVYQAILRIGSFTTFTGTLAITFDHGQRIVVQA